MKSLVITILAALLVISLQLSGMAEDQPSVELKFSHKLHVAEQELECSMCHASAAESVTGSDNLLPSMDVCADCHDVEADDGCVTCHSRPDEPMAAPRVENYSPKFSHQKHLGAGLECATCHANVNGKETVLPYQFTDMKTCMNCHSSRGVSNECATCHLPGEELKPKSHTVNFLHTHGDMARTSAGSKATVQQCATCHQQNFCQECHEGENLERLTHPLNYAFTHSLDAMGKERDCATCHTEKAFCSDCHVQNRVMPHNHTAGWVNRIPEDGGRHRIEAQTDLENCMACHEHNAQQICQSCHSK